MDAEAPLLETETTLENGVVTVRASGEVDVSTVAEFEAALIAAARSGAGAMRIDLAGVGYLGSEGVRALIRAHAAAVEAQVEVAIVQASDPVRRVFEVVQLEHLLAGRPV